MIGTLATDAVFDSAIALDGVFTPSGGDPVAVRVLRTRPSGVLSFGSDVVVDRVVFRIRASEVASPAIGDGLTVDAVDYLLQGEPILSPSGAVWTLDVRAA